MTALPRAMPMQFRVVRVEADSAHLEPVRDLFREYADWLKIDLCFQGFEQELANLPGDYQAPFGTLLLALDPSGFPLGCVAVRALPSECAELKRLYLRPRARGLGLGRALTEQAMAFARGAGYRAMRLDTLAQMTEAQSLYERLGFTDIPAYYNNPTPETRYMECLLF